MYKILVRTAYSSTPIQHVEVNVIEFSSEESANAAYDKLCSNTLARELKDKFINEIVTKLY